MLPYWMEQQGKIQKKGEKKDNYKNLLD